MGMEHNPDFNSFLMMSLMIFPISIAPVENSGSDVVEELRCLMLTSILHSCTLTHSSSYCTARGFGVIIEWTHVLHIFWNTGGKHEELLYLFSHIFNLFSPFLDQVGWLQTGEQSPGKNPLNVARTFSSSCSSSQPPTSSCSIHTRCSCSTACRNYSCHVCFLPKHWISIMSYINILNHSWERPMQCCWNTILIIPETWPCSRVQRWPGIPHHSAKNVWKVESIESRCWFKHKI